MNTCTNRRPSRTYTYTAGVESDRCPQAPETFPNYEVEVDE